MVEKDSGRKKARDLELDLMIQELGLSLDLEICIPLCLVKDQKVPALAKIIYGVLKSFCVGKQERCNPSLIEIADRSGLALPNLPRNLKNLEKAGYIRIKRDQRRNHYEFVK